MLEQILAVLVVSPGQSVSAIAVIGADIRARRHAGFLDADVHQHRQFVRIDNDLKLPLRSRMSVRTRSGAEQQHEQRPKSKVQSPTPKRQEPGPKSKVHAASPPGCAERL